MQPSLIGFTGLKGSGKDTAAQVFLDHGWKKLAFAQTLKDMVHVLLKARGCPDPERYTDGDRKEFATPFLAGRTARHVMQTLGTEWGRNLIGDALWIDTWALQAANFTRTGTGVVVTDVRFPNEVTAIKALGGIVVRVSRRRDHVEDLHPSEALVDTLKYDTVIENNYPTARDFQVAVERRFF